MQYRILGSTGLSVSVLSVGTWQLSGPVTLDGRADGFPDVGREQAVRLIRACGDLGINSIDCAEIYGKGEGERRVAEAIRGQRDRWILTTKFGIRSGPNSERVLDAEPQSIPTSLEGSLKRLKTDYVDVYLYHAAPNIHSILEGREQLEELRRAGKLRAYGVSTDLPELVLQFAKRGAAQVVMFPQSLLSRPARLLEAARKYQFGVMLRGALAGGRLSGRYFRTSPEFSQDDIRNAARLSRWQYPVFERFRPAHLSMPAFALRYLLDFETTHTIVLGGRSIEQYTAALAAVEARPLTTAQHLSLNGLQTALTLQAQTRRLVSQVARPIKRVLSRA